MTNKLLSMIGLATRAGKTLAGEFQVLAAIKSNEAKLVIISEEASDNTKKMFSDKCNFYDVPIRIWGNTESLGRMSGKGERVSLAITDEGFAGSIKDMIDRL